MPSSVTVKTKGKMNEQHRPMHFDKNEKNETKFFRVKECLSHRSDQNEGMIWVRSATNNERDHFSTDNINVSSRWGAADVLLHLIPMHWHENKSLLIHLRSNFNIVVAQPSEGNIFFRHCSISFPDADQSDWKMSCTWSLPGLLNIFKLREERNMLGSGLQ